MNARFIQRHWYRISIVSLLLYPISFLFGLLVGLRRTLYRFGILSAEGVPVPVVIVGNLTVGGTGKTPLVLWVVHHLRDQGWHPGIIAGGYGGTSREPNPVAPDSDPRRVGDEAVLLAQRSLVPVWSGRDRVLAARSLLQSSPECNVIILDDGLQHYRLRRDIEIAVEDSRGMGNGWLLPAGPLREPASRQVDARVVNAGSLVPDATPEGAYRMRLSPAGIFRIDSPAVQIEVASLLGKRLHAVAGIGEPARFFATLRELGLTAVLHAFPDHHDYSEEDLDFDDCDAVLMTEKDAVKCRRFSRADLYVLRVEAALDSRFSEFLEQKLHGLKAA